jgi:NADPH-dependent curcumin reductase CurA
MNNTIGESITPCRCILGKCLIHKPFGRLISNITDHTTIATEPAHLQSQFTKQISTTINSPRMVQNKGLIFKEVPFGWPVPGKDLAVEAREIDLDKDIPASGAIVRNHYVSYDPYQRGRMRAPTTGSYSAPFSLGKPITNRGVSTVVASQSEKFKVGDVLIVDQTGTEEYTALSEQHLAKMARLLDNPHKLDPKLFIGALGMPGLTAWSSLYEIGEPKKGEVLFVSSASGAVGALVGQLGKKEGLKVIGSVGSDEKLDYIINELGFDGGFNYKTEKPADALKRLAPDGIDIYYENVGGEQLEAALDRMNLFGRIGKKC